MWQRAGVLCLQGPRQQPGQAPVVPVGAAMSRGSQQGLQRPRRTGFSYDFAWRSGRSRTHASLFPSLLSRPPVILSHLIAIQHIPFLFKQQCWFLLLASEVPADSLRPLGSDSRDLHPTAFQMLSACQALCISKEEMPLNLEADLPSGPHSHASSTCGLFPQVS